MRQTLYKHTLSIAEKQHLVKISSLIHQDIEESQILDGVAVVYCPGATAGIAVSEKGNPDVGRDVIYGLEKAFPSMNRSYRNMKGNSHAYLKSAVCGLSTTLIIDQGKLILGEEQEVYFCEFDGPCDCEFYVKVMEG